MPLTWDLSACVDLDLIKSEGEWAITEVLIFGTMHTGIGKLTAQNADEFYARMHLLEQLYGGFILAQRNGKRIDRPLMPLDIYRRVGMKTNASFKDESRASFMKRHVTGSFMRDGLRRYKEALEHNFDGALYAFKEPEEEIEVATAS